MTTCRLLVTAPLVLLSLAGAARAGGLKAHVECSLDGGARLAAKKKIAIDKDVWCSIMVDKGAPPADAVASIWIEQPLLERATEYRTANVVAEDDLTYFQLGEAFARGKDFLPCTDVVAHGRVKVGDDTVWSGTFAIGAKCKAIKLAAKLQCSTTAGDTFYKFPGNGSKVKPRMERELDCSLASKTSPPDGSIAVFRITHPDGTATPPKFPEFREYPQGGFGYEQAFEEGDYGACSTFTLKALVFTPDGQILNTSKLAFAQDCPD
ncbi:MAG: hypothetical protein K8W52_28130 [Deltaproteobacteria bacterium]|nr:hypothetical protein [Deltaproteobacteria bacterium]